MCHEYAKDPCLVQRLRLLLCKRHKQLSSIVLNDWHVQGNDSSGDGCLDACSEAGSEQATGTCAYQYEGAILAC